MFLSAFLLLDKRGELSEIEQFDNYNLFVTTQFGKEGSLRIVCHSPGKRPQVQQSTFFLPPCLQRIDIFSSSSKNRESTPNLGLLSKLWQSSRCEICHKHGLCKGRHPQKKFDYFYPCLNFLVLFSPSNSP